MAIISTGTDQLNEAFRCHKKQVGKRWRMDDTYIKVKGQWKYYYRAVNKNGNTIDFLLTARRDKKAAFRFFKKAIGKNGKPSLINIDKSGANTAAINQFNRDNNKRIKIRQCKYLNNIVEQDHRRIKRLTRSMRGFKNFHCAQKTLAGIEVMAMIKKSQMKTKAEMIDLPLSCSMHWQNRQNLLSGFIAPRESFATKSFVVPRGGHCPKADEEVEFLIVGLNITSNEAGGKPNL